MKLTKHSILSGAALAAIAITASSCTQFQTREQNSAATGAVIGAGTGALLSRDPVKGAAAGAAVGAAGGYLLEKSRN